MSSYKSWIATTLLPLEAAPPGRLVEDIINPQRNYQDTFLCDQRPDCPDRDVSELPSTSFYGIIKDSKANGLSSFLTTLLVATFNIQKEEIASVSAESTTTRTLSNSTPYFAQAQKATSVRNWLEQAWRKRKKAYVVVGVKTVTNTNVTISFNKSRELDTEVVVPGSLTLLAATQGAIPTLGGIESVLDSGIGTSQGRNTSLESRFVIPGESIIAVQYRKVDFSWFQNPSLREVGLKDELPWKVYIGKRGEEDAEEEEDQSYSGGGVDSDGFIRLKAEMGGDVQVMDLGELDDREQFVLDGVEEIWHVS